MILSVIVPFFNAEATLERCIQSFIAAAQDRTDIEVILVDDGSRDASLDIAQRYAATSSFIKVLQQVNMGPSVARNTGLDAAQGKFVCFVDSDDVVFDQYFTTIIGHLEEQTDILIFGFEKDRAGTVSDITFEVGNYDADYVVGLLKAFYKNRQLLWFPWNKAYSRSLIEDIRFNRGVFVGEDTLFNLEAFSKLRRQFKVIDNVLYRYNLTENSLTQIKFWPDFFHNISRQFDEICTLYRKDDRLHANEYMGGIAKYYLNHSFFWVLKNALNNPDKQAVLPRLMRFRNSNMFTSCFEHYNYDWKLPTLNLYLKLFEWKWIKILIFISRHIKPRLLFFRNR